MSPGLPGVGAKVELEMMDQAHLFTHVLTGFNCLLCMHPGSRTG